MRFLLFVFLFTVSIYSSYAQTVNGVPIHEINEEYVQIVGTSKFMSSKVTIEIDFGQRTKLLGSYKETTIVDENEKRVDFNSMVDALNFMTEHGYTFAVSNQNVYHFLMKKTE
ncbi:hypothetical protein HX109_03705 [Galbibacter sp. BG1]|uniref:hypothetical protein n=1 Tax=Galbibacter sp. BG1 TaxID=1170699 RepID=UPI0015BEA0E1|nr:hypothetical protein [Galbibacter sp. BG1]QLE00709.1 hypothetical protein HX109_03705 [Galbibacter sp. BG1]